MRRVEVIKRKLITIKESPPYIDYLKNLGTQPLPPYEKGKIDALEWVIGMRKDL